MKRKKFVECDVCLFFFVSSFPLPRSRLPTWPSARLATFAQVRFHTHLFPPSPHPAPPCDDPPSCFHPHTRRPCVAKRVSFLVSPPHAARCSVRPRLAGRSSLLHLTGWPCVCFVGGAVRVAGRTVSAHTGSAFFFLSRGSVRESFFAPLSCTAFCSRQSPRTLPCVPPPAFPHTASLRHKVGASGGRGGRERQRKRNFPPLAMARALRVYPAAGRPRQRTSPTFLARKEQKTLPQR